MTPKELDIIYEWSRTIERELSISIVLNKIEQSERIESFCDDLVQYVTLLTRLSPFGGNIKKIGVD
jgi:hypothetical protein